MKPLELSLTGFRSYPTPVSIDFTGKRLAAALGDTGAGKSSLLDAITFALFRKSSWDANQPRQLIADGAQTMSVDLTFLHDGHRWCVHRTMHATNPNAGRHHLINLDTGTEVDGATAVDARVKSVLQMGYDTFLRVGLLPQGKFDQLLLAVPRERSTRLRELFGAESLETIQHMATRHCLSLKELLGEAKAKRATMPINPAQVAAAAGEAADIAEASAHRLNIAITDITALQNQTSAARTAADAASTAARTVAARSVPDARTVLDNLEPVAADVATRRESLDRRAAEAADRESDLTAKIGDAEAGGEGVDALNKAALVLDSLAARVGEHRDERARLAILTERLTAEKNAIAAEEVELAQQAERGQNLTGVADTAARVNKRLRDSAITVRAMTATATTAALRVRETSQAHSTAVDELVSAQQTAVGREGEGETAAAGLATAEARLEAIQLRDRAAGIAAELHPGDDCPVCRQQVPTDFEPSSATSAAELRDAKTQLRHAKTANNKAAEELARARATVTAAGSAVSERAEEHQTAQRTAQQAFEDAVQFLADFASLAAEAETDFDAEAATVTLTAATTVLMAQSDDRTPDAGQLTQAIAAALSVCEQASDDRVGQLRTIALRHTAEVQAARGVLSGRKNSHQDEVRDAEEALSRHGVAVTRTISDISSLPDRIRSMLPDDVLDVRADTTAAAAVVVVVRLTEIQGLHAVREAARTEQTAVLREQRDLDRESRATVDKPLSKLRGSLDAWATAAAEAIGHLAPSGRTQQLQLPDAPVETGIAEIRAFANALSETAEALGNELIHASAAHTAQADAACTRLSEQAAALVDIEGFDPTIDLIAPQALHPLVAAHAKAAKEAEEQRKIQHEAQAHIKPAADLDFAIAAGKARLEAMEVLRRELVDAKFLGHLTMLNTRALLGIASELLGRMTDKRFGFADGFDIVSCGSGVVHAPNRLSGGEKFLASLALALALAELHSRSGPRLGSLFLDEGFAALDTTAMDSALDVLRAQAGGDRLVMVISHLHAVAEAVDDVLWVERGTAGSTARWLTLTERDELVQADLASGLQTLA